MLALLLLKKQVSVLKNTRNSLKCVSFLVVNINEERR